jgi:hypothetical protein
MTEFVTITCGNNFPVVLQLLSNATVVVQRTDESFCDIDNSHKVKAIFAHDGFSLTEDYKEGWMNFDYDVPYKLSSMPVLKAWIQQQNLIYPVLKEPVLNTI